MACVDKDMVYHVANRIQEEGDTQVMMAPYEADAQVIREVGLDANYGLFS